MLFYFDCMQLVNVNINNYLGKLIFIRRIIKGLMLLKPSWLYKFPKKKL